MNGCSRWSEAIADCALGKSPSADLAAHLMTCPQCQNALRDSQVMAARIDEALHLNSAVEPPLYGPERTMARIHGQKNTGAWRRWPAVASAALTVLIAAVLTVFAMWPPRRAPQADVAALSTWRSPTERLLDPPVAAAWTTTPRLGEGFFKLKPSRGIHAK
jgi:hypothetical protein